MIILVAILACTVEMVNGMQKFIVKGKVLRIGGFSTPEQAYLDGRLDILERKN